jgi:putative transposase
MPRVHNTPAFTSCVNQVERWFGITTQLVILRAIFFTVKVLIVRIEQFVAATNKTKDPYGWIATVD